MTEGLTRVAGELTLYQNYAQQITAGKIPYVDFFPDYPIGAMWLFSLANIAGEKYFTLIWYAMVALATLGIAIAIKKMRGNPYIFLAAILPLGGLYWDRFDVFSALFSVLAVYTATLGKRFASATILLMGILIKVYPIILAPVIALILIRKSGLKKSLSFLICLGVALITIFFTQKPMINGMFKYHGHRGIQIESVKAMPLLIKKDSVVEFLHGTYEIREKTE